MGVVLVRPCVEIACAPAAWAASAMPRRTSWTASCAIPCREGLSSAGSPGYGQSSPRSLARNSRALPQARKNSTRVLAPGAGSSVEGQVVHADRHVPSRPDIIAVTVGGFVRPVGARSAAAGGCSPWGGGFIVLPYRSVQSVLDRLAHPRGGGRAGECLLGGGERHEFCSGTVMWAAVSSGLARVVRGGRPGRRSAARRCLDGCSGHGGGRLLPGRGHVRSGR